MEHNKFNYSNDIVRPLAYFFKVNNIGVKPLSDSQKNKEKLEKIQNRGYRSKIYCKEN
jgi:hypothetical protein